MSALRTSNIATSRQYRELAPSQQEEYSAVVSQEEVLQSRLAVHATLKGKVDGNEWIAQRDRIKHELEDVRVRLAGMRKELGLDDSASFTIESVSSALQTVSDLSAAAQKFLTVAQSLSGTSGAFARDLPPIATPAVGEDRGMVDVPLIRAESLMTVNARAFLSTPENQDPASWKINFLNNLHINFFERKEQAELNASLGSEAPKIHCPTQGDDTVSGLVRGNVKQEQTLTLWLNESELKWFLVEESFSVPEDAIAIDLAMNAATAAWNEVRPGGVCFKRCETKKEASFLVMYEGPAGIRDVVGFFPARYIKGYSRLSVHDQALEEGTIGNLSNYVLHQLGHILGFRHGFVLEMERRKLSGDTGAATANSVMSLKNPPVIALSDVVNTRKIYQNFSGGGVYEIDDNRGNTLRFKVKRVTP